MSRLALGTVQFGISYGVANPRGKVSIEEATNILSTARLAGVDTLDTAIAYGDSEQRLGKIGVEPFKVVSKLPKLPLEPDNISDWVQQSVEGSLHRLRIARLYGLLLHHPQQLLSSYGEKLYKGLNLLKEQGLVNKIGISIYSYTELEALNSYYSFDIIQAPLNILDRSLEESGWLARLKNLGVEVHVRSVFLQGLLLMNPSMRAAYFETWEQLWKEWEQWLKEEDLTRLQGCLGWIISNPQIDRVLVGVDSVSQLQEILAVTTGEWSKPPDSLCCNDPNLVNPSRWKLT